MISRGHGDTADVTGWASTSTFARGLETARSWLWSGNAIRPAVGDSELITAVTAVGSRSIGGPYGTQWLAAARAGGIVPAESDSEIRILAVLLAVPPCFLTDARGQREWAEVVDAVEVAGRGRIRAIGPCRTAVLRWADLSRLTVRVVRAALARPAA